MLNLNSNRQRRQAERGQVLVMALAFIAFVSLVAVAVFRYADVTQLQHGETAKTAAQHAPSEGAGLYALVDSSRGDAPACVAGGGGDLKFASGETLTYRVASNGCTFSAGNPGSSGSPCAVCVTGNYPGADPTFVLNRAETVTGEVDINGNAGLKNTGSLCVKATTASTLCDGTVVMHNGGTWSGLLVPPTALKSSAGALEDPFSGVFPPPDVHQAGTTVGGVAQPGVYTNLSGNIAPGTYVVTGTLAEATLVNDPSGLGVTIYLACGTGTAWRTCTNSGGTGEAGGMVNLQNTTLTITAPTKGVYAHLAIFADANDTNSVSETGHGQAAITGSVYVPRMLWDIRGNGAAVSQGRLIVGAVSAQVGNGATGLSVTGGVPTSVTCAVLSDTLSESIGGSPTSSKGREVLQTACNGGNQIVSFDYQP